VNPLEADEYFMACALEDATAAGTLGEAPIGAVVVYEGEIIARAGNRREIDADPAGHAEFLALTEAARVLGRWRLTGCTVYVTLEPCLMCAGLMQQSRIDRCVYGASDPKAGALGTLYCVHSDSRLNHVFEVTSGIMGAQSSALLKDFFAHLRKT
jgi:tRNA(adenine34) deaminase